MVFISLKGSFISYLSSFSEKMTSSIFILCLIMWVSFIFLGVILLTDAFDGKPSARPLLENGAQ